MTQNASNGSGPETTSPFPACCKQGIEKMPTCGPIMEKMMAHCGPMMEKIKAGFASESRCSASDKSDERCTKPEAPTAA